MKLFHSPASPFVRKVCVVLHETGQFDQVEIVPAVGTVVDPGSMPRDHNPLGKIPTLLADDGPIYDSRVICAYLDERAKAGLYRGGWPMRVFEATVDGLLEATVLMVYERRLRPEEMQFDGWLDGQWLKVTTALDYFEGQGMTTLNDPELHIGHIGVGCGLGYLDFRMPDQDWRATRPNLAAWYEDFSKRASMQDTIPVG